MPLDGLPTGYGRTARERRVVELLGQYDAGKRRAQAGLTRFKDEAARQADRFTGFAVAIGGAAGLGYYMARYASEKPQWLGFDKEIWITILLAGVAFWLGSRRGRGAQMASNITLNLATGSGAGYAYAWASNKGANALAEAQANA